MTPSRRRPNSTLFVWRIVWGNALAVSALYLAAGTGVEILRRFYPGDQVYIASQMLDGLPSRVLYWMGFLPSLRRLYEDGALSGYWVRTLFGVTAIAVIFALAAVVGLASWMVLW